MIYLETFLFDKNTIYKVPQVVQKKIENTYSYTGWPTKDKTLKTTLKYRQSRLEELRGHKVVAVMLHRFDLHLLVNIVMNDFLQNYILGLGTTTGSVLLCV